MELAEIVRDTVDPKVAIDVVPTDDLRSYHISSAKIARELGFTPQHSLGDAVLGLKAALADGQISDPMNNPLYYNIKLMKQVGLQ